jgi:hypothetical protein
MTSAGSADARERSLPSFSTLKASPEVAPVESKEWGAEGSIAGISEYSNGAVNGATPLFYHFSLYLSIGMDKLCDEDCVPGRRRHKLRGENT